MTRIHTLLAGLTAAFLLAGADAWAQAPANDQCSAAQSVSAAGVSVAGTTVNAADDLIGLLGCQTGMLNPDHPDVWYFFTATAARLTYTVTAAATNPGAPFEVFVFDGTCASGLLLVQSTCGNGVITGSVNGLASGSTYLVTVASPSSQNTAAFSLQLTTSTPPILPSQDCNQATILTSAATFSQGTVNQGSGANTTEVNTGNSCWGSGGERQSKWFKFIAGSTGGLVFSIDPVNNNPPNSASDDYDWAVWDVTGDPTGCTTKGNAIACNWTGARGATGLSYCPGQEIGYLGGDQFDNTTTNQTGANAPITLQAGRAYALLVDNFSMTNSGFTLRLGGACPNPPGGQAIAQIGLDAQFIYSRANCNVISFVKSTPLVVSTAVSYFWNFGDGVTSTQQNPTHVYAGSATSTTTYTVTLQITDAFGNRVAYSQPVTVAPSVVASVQSSSPAPICAGQSVTLSSHGGQTYSWSPATGLSSTTDSIVTAAPAVTTTYTVTATRGPCTDTAMVTVRVTPLPATRATVAIPDLCQGGTTTLTASGAQRYEWSPATGLSSTAGASVLATPDTTTTYTVTGYNGQCGVPASVTINVTPRQPATGTITSPQGVVPHSTGLVPTVANATAWRWDFGDGTTSTEESPTHTYAAPGTYTVTLTVTYGPASCQTTLTEIGKVVADPPIAYNIITPDGDGLNDVFSAPVSPQALRLRVFNRWGRMVYRADDYRQDWNGGELSAGTYYYHLEDASGRTWKGWVEIVR